MREWKIPKSRLFVQECTQRFPNDLNPDNLIWSVIHSFIHSGIWIKRIGIHHQISSDVFMRKKKKISRSCWKIFALLQASSFTLFRAIFRTWNIIIICISSCTPISERQSNFEIFGAKKNTHKTNMSQCNSSPYVGIMITRKFTSSTSFFFCFLCV